jgi:uncharacterized protein with PQ loop repeat
MTSMSLPQIARIVRDRSADGVSLLTWLIFSLSGASWLAYGLILGAPGIIVGNIPFIATTVPVVVLLLRRQRNWPWPAAIAAPVAGVASAVLILRELPPGVPGGLGVACGLLTTVPQLLESLNRRREDLPSEVAMGTLVLLLSGQCLWLSYGIFRPDLPIVMTNVVAVGATVTLLMVEGGRRRTPSSTP